MMKFLLIASGVSAYEKDYDYTPNGSGYAPQSAFRGQSYSKSSSYSSSSSTYMDSNGVKKVSKEEQGEEQVSASQWGANYQNVVEQKKAWGKKLEIAETPTERKESLQEYKKLAKKEQSLLQLPYGGMLFKDNEQKAAYEKSLQQVQTWNPETNEHTYKKHIQQQEEQSQKTVEQLNTPEVQKTATVFDAMKKEMSHSEFGQFVNGINFSQGIQGVTNEMKEQAIHAENNEITTPYSSSVNKVYKQLNKESKQQTGRSWWSNFMGNGKSFFDNQSSSSNFLSKNFNSQKSWNFPSFKMPSFKMPSFSTQGHGYQQQGY